MGFFEKLFGKKTTKNDQIRKREMHPDVHDISTEDQEINWAMEKAKLTMAYFQESLANPKPIQEYFAAKVRLVDHDRVEHIWVNNPSFDHDGNLFGVINNMPIDIRNVTLHQKVGVALDAVSDWMIIESGTLVGGYTIRAIRNRLSGQALKSFDAQLGGLYLDDGVDYFPINQDTPEGAILALEQAYDNDDMTTALAVKTFDKEAESMTQKMGHSILNTKLMDQIVELMRLSFIKGITEQGMPKFHGIRRAFPHRKWVDEDHMIVTEILHHPDGSKALTKHHTYRLGQLWYVGGIESDA